MQQWSEGILSMFFIKYMIKTNNNKKILTECGNQFLDGI